VHLRENREFFNRLLSGAISSTSANHFSVNTRKYMKQLLIASGNPGKLLEIQALLIGMPFELVYPSELGIALSVVEDGSTYAENAALKALAFTSASGLISLADDSGLEVEVLGGLPGLHSARFSPLPGASDADRRAYLLEQLEKFPRPWEAKFKCTVAIASPGGEIHYSEGECAGEIIPAERGSGGFGYDPIFLIRESRKTMAELSMEEKNRLSHRARAIRAAQPLLLTIYQDCKE
jgi:XTP/dITP diphosphohydrolase